ncbi:hypothetical protein BSU01_14440 [Erwinia billingiae]|uniref:type II toxin-antitoxin system MqsA family antitoxin n=1 Tax=Erwinia billingiae TaxID=182337 RepID=UPI0019D046E0|nr:type II toxin-antitoxin system MqsA family antitoxin [Erwinia billingiae]MBN7122899.1 hypothetical protein [Erwinia billingiae]
MKNENACPICNQGQLETQQDQNQVSYKGTTKCLPMRFSICNCCGSETASAADLRENKRVSNDFKKQVDGLLTGSEVREIRTECWAISQASAAAIFGGGPKAFSKYESDDVIQSEAMDKLLRLARDIPDAFNMLKEISGQEVRVEKSTVMTNKPSQWIEVVSELDTSVTYNLSDNHHNDLVYNDVRHWRQARKVA